MKYSRSILFSKYKILPKYQILPRYKRKISKNYRLVRNFSKLREIPGNFHQNLVKKRQIWGANSEKWLSQDFTKFALKTFDKNVLNCWDWSGAKECTSCRSWKMLENECFFAKIGLPYLVPQARDMHLPERKDGALVAVQNGFEAAQSKQKKREQHSESSARCLWGSLRERSGGPGYSRKGETSRSQCRIRTSAVSRSAFVKFLSEGNCLAYS